MEAPGTTLTLDRRAVGYAAVLEVGVTAVIGVFGLPMVTGLVVPVVGSVVAGIYSRNYQEEYIDGAVAAGLAPVIFVVVSLLIAWLVTPAVSLEVVTWIGSVAFSIGIPILLVGTTMAAVLGAFVSYQSASIWRQAQVGIEIK